ncbi:cytochrome c oxidase assembly protein CtaG [Devosia yakushimensis]|uniref:Cytochrome c oxidase assembly protein CtaG n=1 Tax=Devosia yakushimensis TaxID=470028 RepID=A0ABQ5UHY5_9HYPH|nr:cytochrome c oxidase assembly protein [Devosia yakushimensis]GLQ10795.1 cytochrome c oxidase assembly protein CtaG [Devosia yakushimensis]
MADLSHSSFADAARRNKRIGLMCLALAAGMVGLAYASVPLYQLFCQVTGFGGTPGKAESNPKGVIAREMSVRFDSNVSSDLNWTVKAAAPVTDRIGAVDTVNYVATNHSDKPITGMAIFNVSPEKAGVYFNKIECFCFTEQTLQPGETVDMPIVFFVDPELDDNRELDTIKEITLSYTFYASDNGGS